VTICAVDIGARELKLLEARGRQLLRHAEVLLPEGALADGVPTPLFTAAVRGAVEGAGFHGSRVRVAIAETGTAFRDFRLPAMPSRDLAQAAMFEGRRQVPMDPGDVYFAWHAARDGKGYAIYLVAARREMIDGLIATLASAGLRVERMDLKPLALARGLGIQDGLGLEWGAAEATLVFMHHGRPRFFRTFALDAPGEEVDAQFEELALSLNALVKFMRGAAEVPIGRETPLYLGGRFAFLPEGLQRAQQRFDFTVQMPVTRFRAAADFPWQAHFAGLGLLGQRRWQPRITPSQGGDIRVAA
jgi:hypothetical protein